MRNKRIISRILSAALVSAMIVGSIASCSEELKAGVTVASDDAKTYGDWLTEKLDGKVEGSVVVGIGSNDDYDVDMSAFEDDGYVIKKDGDAVFIFGKTGDGLDRGVRKYANTVSAGEEVKETKYHEGARIEKLTFFGTDISEFTIVYAEDHNDNMKFAAEEMQQLLKKATNKDIPVVKGKSDAAHKIELRHSSDAALKDDGYRYFEENGNLVIEGAVARGCSNGVYRFLDNELGWDYLMYGDSYLPEADSVEIAAGLSKTETPIMDYLYVHTNEWNKHVTDRTEVAWNSAEMSYGPHERACHGMTSYDWAITTVNYHTEQICHTSESALEYAYEQIVNYIKKHEKEGGKAGVTLKDIDISQGDNNRYCKCETCAEVMSYDKSTSGPVLQFANAIAERLESDGYNGIAVHIFAYFSTKKPPEVTKAHPNVHITFAQNGNCSNHSMYGTDCGPANESMDKYPRCTYDYLISSNNKDNDRWLSKWCEISDNVIVWYYALDCRFQQYTILDFMLDDFRYMKEKGVRGMFWQNTYHGFGVKRVEHQLGVEINWHNDMTDEEYEAELCKLLEREYGPGWEYVREYLKYMIEGSDRYGCFNCWGMSNEFAMYDFKYVQETYKTQIDLIEKAINMAGSADEEYRCKLLSCSIYYCSVFSQYFEAYENEDADKLEELEKLYKIVYDRLVELGFDTEAIKSVDGGLYKVWPTLEKEAWTVWKSNRTTHVGKEEGLRPEPDWVAEYEESIATQA